MRILHTAATGSDPMTGDGAGILIQIPHDFFEEVCSQANIELPVLGEYGTGLVFLPTDDTERIFCKNIFTEIVNKEGYSLLGWRQVPIDSSSIGKTAQSTQPVIEQVFIKNNKKNIPSKDSLGFERKLYVIRRWVENVIRSSHIKQKSFFYITNLSSRTFSYKGLFIPHQLEDFFLDFKNPKLKSAICVVHSRYVLILSRRGIYLSRFVSWLITVKLIP